MKCAELPASLLGVVRSTLSRLFGDLPGTLVEEVIGVITITTLPRGGLLYTQGESGVSMHIVLTGKLDVSIRGGDGAERIIATARAGESVGEMALLTGSPRAATLRAARDCILAELPSSAFASVMRQHPEALADIARLIIRRLTHSGARAADQLSAKSVAIVPASPADDVRGFCLRLARELLHAGRTLHLSSGDMRRLVARDDPMARNEYLEQASYGFDFMLLEGDAGDEAWTRAALGFADRIFVVARASGDPQPGDLERRLLAGRSAADSIQPELVLLYGRGESPALTRRWLDCRAVRQHYHVPLHGEQGMRRIARNVAQSSIGVVLAGGGARGFAHLGVMRALTESGIAIDSIGGASFGAIAATGPARGFDVASMIDELRHAFTQERPLDDYTLPMVSLIHGERLDELLRKHIDMDIEDLWLPFFAVSSNLTRNRVQVHERGSLWRAVRASISLPAILPPAVDDGDLLIDGGVLNNLPVDVMAERMKGHIIAVDLSAQEETKYSQARVPTGTEYLKSLLNPWREPLEVPTLAKVIMKATTLASRREVEFARRMAHLYLSVPIAQFDLLDWHQFHPIVDAGYRYAGAALEDYVARNPRIVRRPAIGELLTAKAQ